MAETEIINDSNSQIERKSENVYKNEYKIVFLGNTAVGKTSLISQYLCSKIQNSAPTIAIDFLTTTFEIKGQKVKLQIWDTAGQERFRSIVGNYVRNTFLVVLVFSLNDMESVESLDGWIKDFIFHYNSQKKVKILIVGNKRDELTSEEILNKGKELSEKYKTSFVTASAYNKEGIQDMVTEINMIIEEDLNNPESSNRNVENALKVNTEQTWRCC